MSNWISVKDAKPSCDCSVIIASNYGIRSGFFSLWNRKFQDHLTGSDEGMEDWEGVEFKVTHWQPLPEPPQRSPKS